MYFCLESDINLFIFTLLASIFNLSMIDILNLCENELLAFSWCIFNRLKENSSLSGSSALYKCSVHFKIAISPRLVSDTKPAKHIVFIFHILDKKVVLIL